MSKESIQTFVEIGPGKVLTGMVKRTLKNVNCFSINTITDIKNLSNLEKQPQAQAEKKGQISENLKISENETLFLQGQYFDELQYSRKFPNTEFEIVRTELTFNELIDIKPLGEYLKPEKKLKAFTKEQFENNEVHYDGDLLKISIEQIK